MSTDYTGSTTADHGVTKPSLSNAVVIKMLVDLLDPLNASAIHGCSVNVLADWVEFLKQERAAMMGVDAWVSTKAYVEGMMVVDPTMKRMFRAVTTTGNLNRPPSTDAHGDYWIQCDWSTDEIKSFAAAHQEISAPTGIACTRGASVTRADLVITGNTLRQIMLVVQNVPWDNSIQIDLSGSAARFLSLYYGGSATLASSGYQYGGQVGLNPPTTGHDVFTLWAKKTTSDSSISCTVSLTIWGQ